ncbi:MAG: hypothetical protein ACRCS6_11075, partial [Turicibacter sp.]
MAIKLKKSSDDEQVNQTVGDELMEHKKNKYSVKFLKIIVAILSIGLLYTFAIHLISNYGEMEKRAQKQHQQYMNFDYLIQDIQNMGYGLKFDSLKEQGGIEQALSEIVDLEELLDGKDENQQRQIMESLADSIEALDDIKSEYGVNFQYYLVDQSKEINDMKLDDQLTKMVSKGMTSESYQQLTNDYNFFIEISFDDIGNIEIKHVLGVDEETVQDYVSNQRIYVEWESVRDVETDTEADTDGSVIEEIVYNEEIATLKPLKNMTLLAAVSKTVLPGDQLYYQSHMNSWAYEPFAVCYITFFASLIGLFVILLPFKIVSQFKLLRAIIKIPFELLVGALSFITLGLSFMSTELIYMTQSQSLVEFFTDYMPTFNSDVLTDAVNIGFWLVLFTVIYIDFYVLKHMLKVGIFTYIKENTITFKILKFIKRGATSVYKQATHVNLEDKNTKQILILLTVNFVLVSIMCSIWFFGIIAALIYSGVIFFLVTRYMKKIRGDYAKLAQVTHALSEGNVDVLVEEDLGCFNELRD